MLEWLWFFFFYFLWCFFILFCLFVINRYEKKKIKKKLGSLEVGLRYLLGRVGSSKDGMGRFGSCKVGKSWCGFFFFFLNYKSLPLTSHNIFLSSNPFLIKANESVHPIKVTKPLSNPSKSNRSETKVVLCWNKPIQVIFIYIFVFFF